MTDLLDYVKNNLIIDHDSDDNLLRSYIAAAVSYAEGYQHLPDGYYTAYSMTEHTKQAVVMLATYLYESRDGGSGGFFNNTTAASSESWKTVNNLLRLDRDWKV